MPEIVVASQLPAEVNGLLAQRVMGAAFTGIAPGVGGLTAVAAGSRILIAVPFGGAAAASGLPPVPGWPFNLDWVHVVSTGLDCYPGWLFDVPNATYSPAASAVALAEYALAAMFVETKRTLQLWISQESAWRRIPVGRIAGTALGIMGYGAISQALAPRALALGMTVKATRRSRLPMMEGVARAEDAAELFRTCDHVVLAAPATDATIGSINAEMLAQAKPGLHLINVARGSLIDEDALLWALDMDLLAGATLDVTSIEPLPDGHPFYRHPKVRLSPHTAAADPDQVDGMIRLFAENFRRYLAGEPMSNPVGRPAAAVSAG